MDNDALSEAQPDRWAQPLFVRIVRWLSGFRPVDTAPQGGSISGVEPDVLFNQLHELRVRPTDVVTDVED
jgi:hypothetical protein